MGEDFIGGREPWWDVLIDRGSEGVLPFFPLFDPPPYAGALDLGALPDEPVGSQALFRNETSFCEVSFHYET